MRTLSVPNFEGSSSTSLIGVAPLQPARATSRTVSAARRFMEPPCRAGNASQTFARGCETVNSHGRAARIERQSLLLAALEDPEPAVHGLAVEPVHHQPEA